MTIALAAYGPNAGKAVHEGLLADEVLGRGEIGGFAVFSVLDALGAHQQFACRSGGIVQLDDIPSYHAAQCSAVISSGPNRPEPLSHFLVGQSGVGIVTGHRLPNRKGADGVSVNCAVMALMAKGIPVGDAVTKVLGDNPEIDAGLIAVKPGGPIALANTARVNRRPDVLQVMHQTDGYGYAMLCNSIYTARDITLGVTIGAIMQGVLSGEEVPFLVADFFGAVPILSAGRDQIELDLDNRVTSIQTAEPAIAPRTTPTTVIHSGAPVWQNVEYVGTSKSDVLAVVTGNKALVEVQQQGKFIVERTKP